MAYQKKRMAKAVLFFRYRFICYNFFIINKGRQLFNAQSVAIYRRYVGALASQCH